MCIDTSRLFSIGSFSISSADKGKVLNFKLEFTDDRFQKQCLEQMTFETYQILIKLLTVVGDIMVIECPFKLEC